ncbi:hypothetical protein VSO92_08620 [Myroides pelagicus]|uniref:hypothetical protein n=1 Tax=Myroides pelagicus TaxID=270914 RepID=UPI002DBFBC37|nr:hypothetical protein [Myroides pelagicus]MEC4114170.1 hypothetical protein [Myroides pelagicus]
MKKTYIGFAGLSLLLLLGTQSVQAQQGFGTDKPDRSAAVDIQSSKRGLLIPRVDLVETTNGTTPINEPEKSLMVYNKATATDVTPGYYYWDGAKWVRFAQQSSITEITLAGDVTGKTGGTKVVALQGTSISNVAPTANQVLTFVPGTEGKPGAWTPTSITPDVITNAKGITGTGITVHGGENSTLKDVKLAVTPGNKNQVMVTNADGNGTTWVDLSVISPTTINTLTSTGNTMTSNVNDVSGTAEIVNSIGNTIVDNKLVTTVNGIAGSGLDLTPAIQAGQKTTSVNNGSEKVSVVTTGAGTTGNNTEYTVDVVESELKLGNLGGELPVNKLVKGANGQVLVTKGEVSTWVNQSEIVPTTTNSLTKKDNNGTIDQNTIVSSVNGKTAEVKVIDNVANTVTGSSIVTTVNGVASTSVDLKDAILAGQKLTTVSEGAGVKVTSKTTDNTTDYKVAIDTDGAVKGQVLTVGDGASTTWTTPAEMKNIYTHDGTLTANSRTVDFGEHTVLKFQRKTQSHQFTYDANHTGINMFGNETSSINLISTDKKNDNSESKLQLFHESDRSEINGNATKGLWISSAKDQVTTLGNRYHVEGTSTPIYDEHVVIKADGAVQAKKINNFEGNAQADKLVVADKDGVLKTVERKKVAPQFFYMPAVIFDTKTKGEKLTRDLYQDYVNQFTGGPKGEYNIAYGAKDPSILYKGGVIGSTGAPAEIDVYTKNELYYYVTYYDTNVFANIRISADGVLTYDIIGTATPASYMNIVFVIK